MEPSGLTTLTAIWLTTEYIFALPDGCHGLDWSTAGLRPLFYRATVGVQRCPGCWVLAGTGTSMKWQTVLGMRSKRKKEKKKTPKLVVGKKRENLTADMSVVYPLSMLLTNHHPPGTL